MSTQLITSLQAEYVNLFREVEALRKNYEAKLKTLERVEFLLNQDARLRSIREKKLNKQNI